MNTTTNINTGVNSLSYSIVDRGIGGCCDKYNIDALQMNGVNIAFRFTRWDDASCKYYTIPVSVKNQATVIAAFAELDLQEDEPGALLLRGCDDETAAKVGYYAAVLGGELQETATDTTDTVTTANTLTLGKCAYIFHWSNSTYFYGTKEQRTEKNAINKALKTIYDNPEKGVNLSYTVDASGRVLVEVDGLTIAVNDKMIASVSGTHPRKNIINNRVFKPLRPFFDSFKPGTFAAFNQYGKHEYFFGGAKMKSFCIDSFAGADSLNYHRVNFRNNRLNFIIANGKVYSAGGDNYSELTPVDVINALQAESKMARKIILVLFDYLTA